MNFHNDSFILEFITYDNKIFNVCIFYRYTGNNCESCAPGYEGNPLIYGDSCRPRVRSQCNEIGTSAIKPLDECECKDNVEGRYCNHCKVGSFFLSEDFR